MPLPLMASGDLEGVPGPHANAPGPQNCQGPPGRVPGAWYGAEILPDAFSPVDLR